MKYAIKKRNGSWWNGAGWGSNEDRRLYTFKDLPVKIEKYDLILEGFGDLIGGYVDRDMEIFEGADIVLFLFATLAFGDEPMDYSLHIVSVRE